MLNVGYNFGKKVKCFMCKIKDDTDSHLLECVIIKMSNPNLIENSDVKFDYVYSSNMKDVQKISKILIQAMRTREILKYQEDNWIMNNEWWTNLFSFEKPGEPAYPKYMLGSAVHLYS